MLWALAGCFRRFWPLVSFQGRIHRRFAADWFLDFPRWGGELTVYFATADFRCLLVSMVSSSQAQDCCADKLNDLA